MSNIIKKAKEKGEAYWEFMEWLKEVNAISLNVTISREQKRKMLRRKLDQLSQVAYDNHYKKIMQIIQSEKANCEEYKDTETQVDAINKWLPRLESKRDKVTEIIRKRRKGFKLNL